MPRKKGTPKTGGRKKGTSNKLTTCTKAAIAQAFEESGGVKSLVAWAKKNRGAFYALWIKTLPKEIKNEHSGPNGGPITHEHCVTNRIAELAAAFAAVADRTSGGSIPGDRP